MATFDHFEWKWLSFCEFTQFWQRLIFSQLEINQVIQEPTANCMNSCRPPSFCNQHFRFIKVSLFSNESIWDKFCEPILYCILKLITFSFTGLRMPWSKSLTSTNLKITCLYKFLVLVKNKEIKFVTFNHGLCRVIPKWQHRVAF